MNTCAPRFARALVLVLGWVLSLASPGCAAVPVAAPSPTISPRSPALAAGHVVVGVSLDGLGALVRTQAETPFLDGLAARGVDALAAQTVLPSVTLPSHVSMVTGLVPVRHGMEFNSSKPERGPVQSPTIFAWVRAAGGHAGLLVAKKKLYFHMARPEDLDVLARPGWASRKVVDAALKTLAAWARDGRGGFLMVHLAEVDGAGHEYGWGTPDQLAVAHRVDAALGRLVSEVEAGPLGGRVTWIVTADHGGRGKRHGGDTPEERRVPFVLAGVGIRSGIRIEASVSVTDLAPTVALLLGVEPSAGLDGRGITEAFEGP